MCNLYQMTPKGDAERAIAAAGQMLLGDDWEPRTVGPFQSGVFLVPAGPGELRAANPTFPDITPKDGQTIQVWGVVTASIKRFPV